MEKFAYLNTAHTRVDLNSQLRLAHLPHSQYANETSVSHNMNSEELIEESWFGNHFKERRIKWME